MTDEQLAEADRIRLARLAARSQDADALIVECVYFGQMVRFSIDSLQLQHVPMEELWRRYGADAWKALKIPAPVRADTEPVTV